VTIDSVNYLQKYLSSERKVRLVACGGGFVVALGKDVPEGSKNKKKAKEEPPVEDKP